MLELTKREKKLLVIGAITVTIAGFYLAVSLFFNWMKGIDIQKEEVLSERRMIEKLGREYNLLQNLAQQVDQKTKNTDITPIIEELLNTNQLKEKVASVNPSQSVIENKYIKYLVQISLKKVTANEFLSFIKSVENYSSVFLKVDYFHSSPVLKSPGLYNCRIKIATFIQKGG